MKNFDARHIKIIGFDADDTLWVNEPYYRETEEKFSLLLKRFAKPSVINERLYETEMANMELYGYGTKAFVLSLIETAILVSDEEVSAREILKIIRLGKAQIAARNPLLPDVTEVLGVLTGHYRLIVATKGDLLDQERKLRNSGIADFFHHIEIMTDKNEENYLKLLHHLDISPREFLMIGNSLKSDIQPVVNLGGYAIHVPFHITWQHEQLAEGQIPAERYTEVKSISDILPVLGMGTLK